MSRYAPYPSVVIVAALVLSLLAPLSNYLIAAPEGDGPYELDHVVDGDTIRVLIDGESVSIRML